MARGAADHAAASPKLAVVADFLVAAVGLSSELAQLPLAQDFRPLLLDPSREHVHEGTHVALDLVDSLVRFNRELVDTENMTVRSTFLELLDTQDELLEFDALVREIEEILDLLRRRLLLIINPLQNEIRLIPNECKQHVLLFSLP